MRIERQSCTHQIKLQYTYADSVIIEVVPQIKLEAPRMVLLHIDSISIMLQRLPRHVTVLEGLGLAEPSNNSR